MGLHTWRKPAILCLSSLVFTGCSLSPLARRTTDFSTAATAAATQASAAYDTVEQAHRQRQTANLIRRFNTDGVDRSRLQPASSRR